MNVWFELLLRELVLLVMLTAIGLGPVAFLHPSVDRASRLALAPAYGLAISTCVLVTSLYRVPGYKGWPLLIVMMVASLALAYWRGRRGSPLAPERSPLKIGLGDAAQLLALVAIVLVSLNLPLAQRHSVGPVGGYRIADATGYVAESDGAERQSIHAVKDTPPPYPDLTLQYWVGTARNFQQIGFDATIAHVDALLGLHAIDTHSAFLFVLILIVALGIWATVRQVTATRSWAAVIAGALAAGPFFRTLFMDGSEGAISGLAVLVPLLLAGWWALRFRRIWDVLAFGVLAAGLQTLYPLFVPSVVAGAAIVLLVVGAVALRRGTLRGTVVARAFGLLGVVLAVAAAITPVAFERNVRYWRSILDGNYSFAGLPPYDLPPAIVPSWLLQTRELYDLPHLAHAPLGQLVASIAVPLLLLAVIAFGIWRNRVAGAALAIVVVSVFLAYYTVSSQDCSYCAQRNMLVIAPIMLALIGIGLASLRASRGVLAVSVVPLALVLVLSVGNIAHRTALRLMDNSYIFDEQINTVLKHLPDDGQPVEVEGFGAGGLAPMEEPLAYDRVNEVTDAPLSIPAETDDSKGLQYLGGPRPIGVEFRPDYRYILTRLPSIAVPSRTTIDRDGPVALQRRTSDLDVTVTSGVQVPFSWQDASAPAYVVPAAIVRFWVVGGPKSPTPWLKLQLRVTVPDLAVGGAKVTTKRTGDLETVCLPAYGDAPLRRVEVPVTFTGIPGTLRNRFAFPTPTTGVQLVGMSASMRSCR